MSAPGETLLDRVAMVLKNFGHSQAEFADNIGIDPTKLSKSLNGIRRFTSFELARIAEIGQTTVDWLVTGKGSEPPALAARAQYESATPAIHAIDMALVYRDVFDTLRRLDGSRASCAFKTPSLSGRLIDQGAQLANAAREFCLAQVDKDSFSELPHLIESVFGIDVAVRNLGEGIDGLSWCQGEFSLILVSNGVAWTRQRFTLAHELGHALAGDSQDVHVDLDVMAPSMRGREAEIRANAFAANFLMPSDVLNEYGESDVTEDLFVQLLRQFGVSPSALAYRLYSVGLISSSRCAELGSMSSRAAAMRGGWIDEFRKRTEWQSATRVPNLLAEWAFTAYSEGIIGARPLAAVLNVPVDSIIQTPVVAPSPTMPLDEPVFSP